MEKRTLKMYLLLISYAIGLILVVVHFEDILRGIGFFFKLLTPLFVGIVIEFVLNRPYEWFRSWYGRKMKLGPKTAKGIAILTVYLLAFGAVILIVSMVIPELDRNLKMFAANADLYLAETQRSLLCCRSVQRNGYSGNPVFCWDDDSSAGLCGFLKRDVLEREQEM